MKKFSVLVNCYNYGLFLSDCLESVVNQSHKPFEVIFVDDGSQDDSIQIARTFADKLPNYKIVEKENGGQLSAFAAGIEVATGDWLAFLDADDMWKPNHLELVNKTIESNPLTGMVYSQMDFFGPAYLGKPPFVYDQPFGDLGYACILNLLGWGRCVIPFPVSATSAVVIHRKYVENLFPFPDAINFGWKTSADEPLARGAAMNGARRFAIESQTVRYRIHGKNAYAGNQKAMPGLPGLVALTKGHILQKTPMARECGTQLAAEFSEIPNKNHTLKRAYLHAAHRSELSLDQKLLNWLRIYRHNV